MNPTKLGAMLKESRIIMMMIFCFCSCQVSWVRQSDLAILASGGVSHTSDNRITASADETLTDWELQITEAQTKDSVSCLFDLLLLQHAT